jgi:ADP-ribose pyrophosphatase
MTNDEIKTLYEGKFSRLVSRGSWEYVTRVNASGVVIVVPMHDDGRVVLVEQFRPSVDANVIELPAGLSGDTDADELLLEAAKRELEEETGYTAAKWIEMDSASASAGITNEVVTFFLATGLEKVGDGGGVDGENIKVHEIDLEGLPLWVASMKKQGFETSATLFAGLYLASIQK